jgi:hypothetical protein
MSNTNFLKNAKLNKKDEFYTQLDDIEKELKYYRKHFVNKVIYCNCDDPRVSNFFHYFSWSFEKLNLKKLVTACYKNDDFNLFSKNNKEKAIYLEYNGDKNKNKIPDIDEIGIKNLNSDGDFRSEESIELLKRSDIVVTNPPFSLFREYVDQLIKYKKKFIILGHQNAITYKNIFNYIKNKKMWLGHSIKSGDREFQVSDDYILSSSSKRIDEDGKKFVRVPGIRWFTNLDYKERHEDLILFKKYNKNEYLKYENYNAINVDKTKEIPIDYKGHMGVPITFLDKYNPDQFEIIGLGISNSGKEIGVKPYKPKHKKYRKEIQKRGAVDGDLYMIKNREVTVPYARVIIKNKKL